MPFIFPSMLRLFFLSKELREIIISFLYIYIYIYIIFIILLFYFVLFCSIVVTFSFFPLLLFLNLQNFLFAQSNVPLQTSKTLPTNEYPGYDTKQCDGEAPVRLELWGMQSISSLSSPPVPLWPGMVKTDRVLSSDQIELNCVLMLN